MSISDPSDAATPEIQAVTRVGQICALFGPRVAELSAADIADRTGLNRTTAYRYCTSMVTAGILERGSERGKFALGPLMLDLGALALGRQRAVEIARPHLQKLRAAVRMTAVLSIPGAQGLIVSLVEEDTSRVVVITVLPGTKLDTTAAQTRLFLAYADEAAKVDLLAELSPVERVRLEADVRSAREQGFSFVRPPGGPTAIAAPVFDANGLCATVALLAAGDVPDLAPVVEALLATARALSEELGADRAQL